MTNALVIVRRHIATYTVVSTVESGNYLEALRTAMTMERQNEDGEYLVYTADEVPECARRAA